METGSPPHAWGRRLDVTDRRLRLRFTLTCVGTACTGREAHSPLAVHPHMRGDGYVPRRGATSMPVHPHMRGDGGLRARLFPEQVGSPPHAWGRRRSTTAKASHRGFTPTCVGTAPAMRAMLAIPTVHPHMRGDGSRAEGRASDDHGSPPHAWGRRGRKGRATKVLRFTPTCVGTATRAKCAAMPRTVHPHMRGDGTGVRFV